MKILFVTSRNAYSTCGELRLIKNRTITLLRDYKVETDFLLFRDKKNLKRSQETIPCSSFEIITHSFIDYSVKYSKLKKCVSNKIENEGYAGIIISGVNLLPLVRDIKKFYPQIKVLADLHGAFEELIEFKTSSLFKNIVRGIYYRVAKYNEKKYLLQFDGFLAVSHALQDYIQKEYNIQDKPFFIVPCAVFDTIQSVEVLRDKRKYARSKYNVRNDETLFIYSGGISPWQCIEESVGMFKAICERNNQIKGRMLILSGNLQAIKHFECENIRVDSLPADKVQDILCGGDYAFMLRGNFVTNNVAFPNKFLEYVAAGLNIITTNHVHDVRDYINQYNLGICLPDDVHIEDNGYFINKTDYPSNYINRKRLIEQTTFVTTLKPVIDFLCH